MTLDNCIKWYSDEAEKLKDDNPEYAGQCNQIAEWLRELKDLRILIGGEDNYLTEPPEQADVQLVRRGYWKKTNDIFYRYCSECGTKTDIAYSNIAKYCAECGAKMDLPEATKG